MNLEIDDSRIYMRSLLSRGEIYLQRGGMIKCIVCRDHYARLVSVLRAFYGRKWK